MRLLCPSAALLAALLLVSAPLAAPLAAQRVPTRPAKPPTGKSAPAIVPAPAGPLTPAVLTTAVLQGVAYDSIHMEPLVGAIVLVDGADRFAIADSLGRFVVDSIKPGSYRLLIEHPMLDTTGISLVTPPMTFVANELLRTYITVPSGETLAAMFCPAARRALGPGALVGRVREPDSDAAAEGARISFVWYDPDPVGLPTGIRPTRRAPRVREAIVGADGAYRLCGLPEKYEGKLQAQRKDGGATAEVSVIQEGGMLALRSVSVAPLPVATTDSAGRVRVAARGSARVTGRVVNRAGAAVSGARIGLLGSSAATLSRANGEFVLDSVPAGTQALVVRQIGYRPTEIPVELSARAPVRVTVRLGDFVPELTPVEVVSRRDEGLQKVGFLDRKRTAATGYFMDQAQLEKRSAMNFSDLMRSVPGVRVVSQGNQHMLVATRNATGGTGGCVTVFVDGAQWQQLTPGDLDSFVRPEEVAAVEVYAGVNVPMQFTTAGQSCSAVVVWTKTRVLQRNR